MKNILIIGATSAIATATARRFAQQGHHLYLLARQQERLQELANDLRIRGAGSVFIATFDANNFASHPALLQQVFTTFTHLDIALIAHGTLSNQQACERDFNLALQELHTNALSVISLLTYLANVFEQQQAGCIAVISSVAGDRGRQSNYVYGTAKGAVTTFLQGLRNRLHKAGVNVLTIKPGFVDTPMTTDFSKNILWAQPEEIAIGIETAIQNKKDSIYLPKWWFFIMAIIKNLPESLFKRLNL